MMDFSKSRMVKIAELADIERGQNGKIYPAGCVLIPLSASDYRLITYLEKKGEVSGRYAVINPHEGISRYYFYIAILKAAEQFFFTYQTGINLQLPVLTKYYTIQYHDDKETQEYIADQIKLVDKEIKNTEYEINQYSDIKQTFLQLLFA